MGKRSDFERVEKDFYPTIDPRAGEALNRYFSKISADKITYAEPCVGGGHLIDNLKVPGSKLECVYKSDISEGVDALALKIEDLNNADLIITNPVWERKLLHQMIEHFTSMKDTWLLFDADWMHTKQSSAYMKDLCTDVVSIGRLKWIEGTTMSGKDNCCWYKFSKDKNEATIFYGR